MAMNMDDMQMMMAKMHEQNYTYDTQLAHYFSEISSIFSKMAQGEYQMFQKHLSQAQSGQDQAQVFRPQTYDDGSYNR